MWRSSRGEQGTGAGCAEVLAEEGPRWSCAAGRTASRRRPGDSRQTAPNPGPRRDLDRRTPPDLVGRRGRALRGARHPSTIPEARRWPGRERQEEQWRRPYSAAAVLARMCLEGLPHLSVRGGRISYPGEHVYQPSQPCAVRATRMGGVASPERAERWGATASRPHVFPDRSDGACARDVRAPRRSASPCRTSSPAAPNPAGTRDPGSSQLVASSPRARPRHHGHDLLVDGVLVRSVLEETP